MFHFSKDKLIVERSTLLDSFSTICFDDFDVIHTHGFRTPQSSITGLFRKMHRDCVIMTVHTFFPAQSTLDGVLKNFYDASIGNLTIRSFDAFIPINNQVQSKLLNIGVPKDKITLIPNSVDTERFENLPSPNIFLNKIGACSKDEILLMVGRIDWQKGLDSAIKTFARVHKDNKNTKLVIVGKDFGFQGHLQDLAEKYNIYSKVIFAGDLDEETLHSAYASAKVLLMTSVYEGLPTVLLEAMASGLPVVSTPLIGISEIIPEGVIWCNKEKLPERINDILTDKNLRETISIQEKIRVKKDFDWTKNSEKILDVYKSVLNC